MKKKIICFLLTFAIFVTMVLNTVVEVEAFDVSTTLKGIENASGDAGSASGAARKVMGAGLTVLQIVGTGIAVIMLTYVAIKYMTASPEGKAEFKKSATAYVVGAIVLFGASNLVKIIANFSSNNVK